MRYGIMALVVIALTLIALVAWREWPQKQNVRITVTMKTPEGTRSDSSIIELSRKRFLFPASSGATSRTKIRGEAVLVEISGQPNLIVLVGDRTDQGLLLASILSPLFGQEGGRIDLREYPRLVRFNDPTDVTSMELLDADMVPVAYGHGHKLTSIIAEPTDEAITQTIEGQLPRFRNFGSWQRSLAPTDPRSAISRDDFIRKL